MRCFNPRPLLLTGESFLGIDHALLIKRFNPRPLLLTGESIGQIAAIHVVIVSIHARYC